MAEVKISALPAATTPLAGTELVPVVQGGVTKQVVASALASGGSGTVTSVAVSVPTGLSVSGSPVTSSGTVAISYSAGYAIPTTAKQSEWDTAYGWGNHASAGYLTSAAIGTTVQAYDADLTSWAGIAPSSKQDALVSATNIKTINGASVLGSGDLIVTDSSKVSKTGDTMTGPLSVPAEASGPQVPQAQEVYKHAFPSGTTMLFAQTAAPTGWTKSTAHNNKALRVVSGTAGSGGSVAFTTAFANQAVSGTVGNTTLTTAQIPSHNHTSGAPGLFFFGGADTTSGPASGNGFRTEAFATSTGFNGGGTAHNHSFTGTAINLAVQYVDVIIATKD